MRVAVPDLSELAVSDSTIAVRVTPGAAADALSVAGDGSIRIRVREKPEDGRATAAAQVLLARALGVPKSRLTLVRGAGSREKAFRLD